MYADHGRLFPEKNPLLVRNNVGATLLHIAPARAERFRDSVEIFRELLKALSNFVDLKEYISEQDFGYGRTPLMNAAVEGEFDFVKVIVGINPDMSQRSHDGFNALDHACLQLALGHFQASSGYMASDALEGHKNIIYYLLENGNPLSFSIFETPLFNPEYHDGLSQAVDMRRIIAVYEANFVDPHGWSVVDVLKAMERQHLIQFCSAEDSHHSRNFTKPSKIMYVLGSRSKLSDDGLECFVANKEERSFYPSIDALDGTIPRLVHIVTSGPRQRRFGYPLTILIGDSPIPPQDSWTYFEMNVPELFDETVDSAKDTALTTASYIGIRPILNPERELSRSSSLFYATNGTVREIMPKAKKLPPHQFNVKGLRQTVIGCGVNTVKKITFFTVNGEPLTTKFWIQPGRYFPAFMVPHNHERLRVNFGAEKFAFERANHSEWDWDLSSFAEGNLRRDEVPFASRAERGGKAGLFERRPILY